MNKMSLFYQYAKGKLTTYVGLSIAGISQVAVHAEDLLNKLPELKAFAPQAKVIQVGCGYIASGLGLLVIYTRVRRLLSSSASTTTGTTP
jgi:hypothetical protein